MKQILCTLLLLCSFWNYGIGQIQYDGCSGGGGIAGAYPYTLNTGTPTNDAGTIRNTYQNSAAACALSAACVFRVQWDIGNARWEIEASSDGGASFPFLLYINTTASFPDPPSLSLGSWVAQGPCGGMALGTWTGSVQSTVSSGAPEINMIGNGNSIVDGDITPSVTDDTDFGNINLGGNDVHTFTIDNSAGTAALTISSVNVSGANAADFVRGAFPASIAAGATGNFTVTFTPSAVGVRNATVTVNNDDANEAVYDYAVRGTGVGLPEINMIGNSNSITDGDVTPSTTDDTDFGNITLGGNDVHTFTIDNSAGTAALTISSVNVSGANAADFVRGAFPASIAAGGTGNFTVTFTPSALGVRNATVTVNNNDANEAVYDYAVQGAGLETIAITEWITNPIGNDATDEWVELHNFGATPIDIQNWEIEDEDADDDVITTSSFIIPAGGYVILAKNKAMFEAQWLNGCTSINVIEVAGLTLANGTDEIIIKDASNNVIWSVAYKNDDASGIATQYTEAPTFTNHIWGSKVSIGVDRTGNDPATGTLGYENNNATADPNVMTSTTGDMGSPFDGTYIAPVKTIVRGDVLDFDGTDDYVVVPNSPAFSPVGGSIAFECWAKSNTPTWSGPDFTGLVSHRGAGLQVRGLLGISGTSTVGFWVDNVSIIVPVIDITALHHYAGVYDGTTMFIYVDGQLAGQINYAGGIISYADDLYIGRDNCCGNRYTNGQIDEVRVWNTTRTANEIRENMHLTLKDCPTGLVAYYQMNDGTGSGTLADGSGNGHVGTLTGMDPASDWMAGGVNIGNDAGGNSNSQTINTAAGVSTQNFAAANATMRFFSHSGVEDITVTYQAFTPNGIVGADGVNIIQNPMWTVNKSSAAATMIVDYTFVFAGGTFTSIDAAKYSLYYRAMNSEGNWTKVATASTVTTTSATFGKISLAGQFMVVQDSEDDISDVRGNMYNISENFKHILCPGIDLSNSSFTIELWAKRNSTTTEDHFFGQGTVGTRTGLHARYSATSISFAFFFDDLVLATPAATDGEWHHLAFVYNSATRRREIFVDGVLLGFNISGGNFNGAAGMTIGGHIPPAVNINNSMDGSMDEFRIWTSVRTEAEIRENMHLTLKGNETGLLSYYQFNNDDPVGINGVKDAVGGNHGTTQNMVTADYVPSEVAVAGGTSDRITIGAGGVYTFPNTDVTIEFGTNTPSGEIVVSRLETEKPHGWESIGNDVDNEYFVVNNYGANASFDPLVDLSFNRLSYVSPTDASLPQATTPLQVYKRADNAFGATWGSSFGGADNATAGSNAMISFDLVNNINSFSQIVLANNSNNSDLPVELMKFDAIRLNADKVQLDWITATELNNEGFYIERMLETEKEFSTVAYIEGQGNSTAIVNYQLLDENTYTSVSYYRLRQVDFDGTTTYSEIRAVEGRGNKLEYMDVSIYPNPVQKELKIRFNDLPEDVKSAQVRIMSIDGKVLYEFTAGVQSYQLLEVEEVAQLSGGLYLLSIDFDNSERVVQKFIKE